VEKNPEINRPLYHVPHYHGVTGTAARLVKHCAERMQAAGIRPSRSADELAAE
jgi:hypothetical protein